MRFRKPELIPLLFIITSTLVLGGLGVWQLERLERKEGLIAAIDKAQSEPALEKLPQDLTGLDYRSAELSGKFINSRALRRVGGVEGEGPGFFILTPFKLEKDGRIILVNRGFAPSGKEGTPTGIQTVKGILRPPREKRYFSPENQMDENLWFYEDMKAMEESTGLSLLPLILEQVGPRLKNSYPIPNEGKIALRNDHLGYAITWFALAIIGIIMFAGYHRIPANKQES